MNLNRIQRKDVGRFLEHHISPKRNIKEFKIDRENFLPIGYCLGVRHFTIGQFVDVTGKTKGKGFMSAISYFDMRAQSATHGTHGAHRSVGSIGQRQDPGRVFKGRKMPGRHGFKVRTIKRLQVYKIDYPRSLIFLKGSVMGSG
jgi:large subunit ribosomal protein L3